MKCYTVTENGITPGIGCVNEPYPHVPVGDRRAEPDYRRVALADALAGSAVNGAVTRCSLTLESNDADRRRASYKLVPPSNKDDDQALVKFEVHAAPGARSAYDFPRYTFTVAKGWISDAPGRPQANTPVELVVLKRGATVTVTQTERGSGAPQTVMQLEFDGNELRRKR